jgi:RNA polymerase sigma-70 factor (ECF subfamily)
MGEDVMQDAFLDVWRAASMYRADRGPLRRWLFTIARNAAIDAARKRRDPITGGPRERIAEEAPDERMAAEELAYRVHAAVDALPEHQRSVIELTYWRHLSQREAAGVLGIPLGTVKTRARSALSILATTLNDEDV